MCVAQGPQCSDAGEARTLGLKSNTLPLSQCNAAFHLGLHCLQNYSLRGFLNIRGKASEVEVTLFVYRSNVPLK